MFRSPAAPAQAVAAASAGQRDSFSADAARYRSLSLANVGVAALLYTWREGDANMRSVWLCSRNDALGNLAVMGAAVGVFGTRAAWPDLVVATGMAALAISGGWSVLKHARSELKDA